MDDNSILDSDLLSNSDSDKIHVDLIDTTKFIILCFLTLGIYSIWWMYKSWKHFKEKDMLDIIPAARAIFSILFAYSLFERIQVYAHSNGYNKSYSSGLLFVGYLISSILTNAIPDDLWQFIIVMTVIAICFLILPFKALNYAIMNSDYYHGVYQKGFNARQWVLIGIGLVFTLLIIAGSLLPEEDF